MGNYYISQIYLISDMVRKVSFPQCLGFGWANFGGGVGMVIALYNLRRDWKDSFQDKLICERSKNNRIKGRKVGKH